MKYEEIKEQLEKLRSKNTLMPRMYSFTEVKQIVAYFDLELLIADQRWKNAEAEIAKHKDEFGNWLDDMDCKLS